jgi:putative long chain acyl-CoA synthase
VAAVTLRPGGELTAKELTRALDGLPPAERPAIVRVVDSIPVTTWYRPLTGPLRDAGIPSPDVAGTAWHLDDRRQAYRALTATARRKLAGAAIGG